MRIEVSVALLTLLIVGSLSLALNVPQVRTEPIAETIIVPDNYPTIQEAINNADEGDVIFVRHGTYYENLVVNKSVSLVGEDRETTTIDGNYTGNAMNVTASNVTIQGFTILTHTWASGPPWTSIVGIYLNYTNNCVITNNTIKDNNIGIRMQRSSNNTISGNTITKSDILGIYMGASSRYNSISYNNIIDASMSLMGAGIVIGDAANNVIFRNYIAENFASGIYITMFGGNNYIIENNITKNKIYGMQIEQSGNFIYHNNFIDNVEEHVEVVGGNTWDNCSVGNYWSDYDGTDLDGDGIGDTNLPWKGVDYYPLMNVFWRTRFYWNPGDVNHDLAVNLFDAVKVLLAYGSEPGDSNWNPQCDIAEPYNKIDLYDAILVLKNYGRKYD